MTDPKKPEPDGYFKRGFMGAWDIKDGHYVDEIAYLEDYKAYEPVYFSTEPPVPKEVLELIRSVRGYLMGCVFIEKAANAIPTAQAMLDELESILPGETKDENR